MQPKRIPDHHTKSKVQIGQIVFPHNRQCDFLLAIKYRHQTLDSLIHRLRRPYVFLKDGWSIFGQFKETPA